MPIYVKVGAIVTAEQFDPARDDQGVKVIWSEPTGDGEPPQLLGAVMETGLGVQTVRDGDWIVQNLHGTVLVPAVGFHEMYQPLGDVVEPVASVAAPAVAGGVE